MPKAPGLGPTLTSGGDGPTPEAFRRLIKENDVARLISHHYAHRQSSQHQLQKFLALAERVLGLFALSNILHRAKHANWLARFVTHNFITNMHESDVAIRPHKSDFDIEQPLALQRFAEDLLMVLPVVGMNKLQQLSLIRHATERFQSQDTTGFFRPGDP